MNDSLSTKHLKEMEQFLSSSEQLKIVLNNLEKLDTANKNDLYEIVYSKKVIEDWLSNTIENESIRESLEELLQSINLVLNSLSNSTLKTIADRDAPNTKDLEKLNKLKYDDKKKYKGLVDKKQTIQKKKQSLMQKYITKKFLSIVTVFTVVFFINTGGLRDMSKALADKILSANTNEQTEQINETNAKLQITKDTLEATRDTLETSIENLTQLLFFVTGLVSFILVITISLRTCIDILYLTMPMIRMMGIFNRYISEDTLELIRLDAMELPIDENKVINYRDKFEVALALLHNTEDYLERVKLINSGNINKEQMLKVYEILNELEIQLSNIKKGIKSSNIIKRVESLADAELLYTKYKDDIERD